MGPGTSILACLTASNREICQKIVMHDTLPPSNLSHMDFLEPPAGIHPSTMTISRATQDASPNELTNPEKSLENRPNRTHSFALMLPAFNPA